MAKHRAPEPLEEKEQVRQHAGWVALFLWVAAGLACVAVGCMCCMGISLKG